MSGITNDPITLHGWSVTIDEDEPTILDEELAIRLGFSRPRDIRKLVERMIADGIINDSDIRATVARVPTGVSSIAVTQYRLTEIAALLVIGRSDTKLAHAITRQVVQLFIAIRRGQLAAPQPDPVPVLPTSPTLGDLYHDDTKSRCAMTARCTGQSIHRVQGWLRVLYNVPSVYRINAVFRDVVFRQLEGWALGRMALPSGAPRQLPAVSDVQIVMPFLRS